MSTRWKDVLAGAVLALIAITIWLPQLRWGLPSRDADRWLFGGREAWGGAEVIDKLAVATDGTLVPRGADVDATPILDRSEPVILNDTDAKRAAIVQRFRLMSGQPDEFIQFKALAEMSQRSGLSKLDPRLYQYGGLWIYPVGGLVRAAMSFGWIETPPAGVPAREFYLDRPEAFAKFYVVGRAYSMAWGIVGAIAVYLIARSTLSRDATPSLVFDRQIDSRRPATALHRGYRIDRSLALLAAIAFILLPSVQTSAHEAKPHLAGAALCLLATLAASHFVSTGKRRWLLIAGALCGAAMSMVVSMVLSLVVLPAAVFARRRTRASPVPLPVPGDARGQKWGLLVATNAVAFLVYAVANPSVLINAITAPHLLVSNLGNSTAMYGVRGPLAMIPDAVRIAGHAMTPLGARFALAAVVALAAMAMRRAVRRATSTAAVDGSCRGSQCILQVVAAFVAIQFLLLAAGKPAEYARFGLVLWAALCVAAVVAIQRVAVRPASNGAIVLVSIIACLLIRTSGFGRNGYDAWKWAEVDDSAVQLETMRSLGQADGANRWRVGVAYEPAPWSTPPMNLFDQDIVLVRATPSMLDEVNAFVWPVDLESQIFEASHDRESLDWRHNRFGHRAEARDGAAERWRGGW